MATATQEIRDLRDELNELRASVKRTSNGIHKVASHEIGDLAHQAGATVRDLWDRSRSSANNAYANYEAQVARHPLSSVVIGVAAGALLGALFARRS